MPHRRFLFASSVLKGGEPQGFGYHHKCQVAGSNPAVMKEFMM
jgi:hypothetical protein